MVAHGARTLVYHPRDLIALRAKLHYTTLIVLPDGDDVVEATCHNPLITVNVSPAAVYRSIGSDSPPTLLIDELVNLANEVASVKLKRRSFPPTNGHSGARN